MPKPTDALFTPPSSYSPQKPIARLDLGFDSPSDDVLDADIFNMTGTGSLLSIVPDRQTIAF
jgi:hypothetical protein